jgi:MYXO-CTERM domain-containing protein
VGYSCRSQDGRSLGGVAATLLGLLLLWPRRRSRSVDDMRRLGVEVRGEPDLGGQSVAHLADPPIGPRISVRTKTGTHRYKVKLG